MRWINTDTVERGAAGVVNDSLGALAGGGSKIGYAPKHGMARSMSSPLQLRLLNRGVVVPSESSPLSTHWVNAPETCRGKSRKRQPQNSVGIAIRERRALDRGRDWAGCNTGTADAAVRRER